MKPYPQKKLSLEKYIFNYQLSRMRCILENASSLIAGECLESCFSQNWKKSNQLHLLSLHFTIGLERSLILAKNIFNQHQLIVKIQKLVKLLKGLPEKKSPQNHGSHYLTQELKILLTKQNVSGENLQIILPMRVVFPGNGNAQDLIFKQ